MNRPGLLEGIAVACIASVAGGLLFLVLAPIFSGEGLLRVLVAVIGLCYVVYLLRRSHERIGRITTLVLWAAGAAAITWFAPSFALYTLSHAGLAWLVRALYHSAGPISALADLGLTGIAWASAAWAATQTHSLFASLWCFFLVQALFAVIPARIGNADAEPVPKDDRFERAYRAAQASVQKLSSIR
jgi:hypothetical protein